MTYFIEVTPTDEDTVVLQRWDEGDLTMVERRNEPGFPADWYWQGAAYPTKDAAIDAAKNWLAKQPV